MKSDGCEGEEGDQDQVGVLPEILELQRTRMIVGPELNYHVRAQLPQIIVKSCLT